MPRFNLTWRISTGVYDITLLSSVHSVQEAHDDLLDADQDEDADDRRDVQRPEPRQDAPEEPQVRLAYVVEEFLQPVERIRHADPRRQDVDEDEQHVDADEDGDEALRCRDRVRKD